MRWMSTHTTRQCAVSFAAHSWLLTPPARLLLATHTDASWRTSAQVAKLDVRRVVSEPAQEVLRLHVIVSVSVLEAVRLAIR